jgi:nucleoside-diphosphate-sugar epimerase
MSGTLLFTGGTGSFGMPLLAELLREKMFDRIIAVVRVDAASLRKALHSESPGLSLEALSHLTAELGTAEGERALATLPPSVDCIVHAAACTKFRAPIAQLTQANVDGTRQILAWAATLPRDPRVVHFSTTCVAGCRTGEIAEVPLSDENGFVNDYERTKWQAEQIVAASPLRPEVVRFATIIGNASDGHLQRPGAFHTTLRWLHAGLLPMVPGDETTRLDLLPTELGAGFVSRLLARPMERGGVYQVSNGARGVPLGELLDLAVQKFAARSAAWRKGQVLPPVLATHAAFDDFRSTIVKTRDFLFNQVLESVDSFLPELFYPKRYLTTRAEAVWGGPLPLPEWREWAGRVIDNALDTDFGRREIGATRA